MSSLAKLAKACFGDTAFYRERDGFLIVATTEFLPGHDESIGLRMAYDGAGAVIVSDCHSDTDYWEVCGIDPAPHKEEIGRIVEEHGLSFDGKTFSVVCDGGEEAAFCRDVARFMQALRQLGAVNG